MNLAGGSVLRFLQIRASNCISFGRANLSRNPPTLSRSISFTACKWCEDIQSERPPLPYKPEGERGHHRRETQVDESVKYMKSNAFKEIYKGEPVWRYYRRNHKGHYPPKPRISCTHRDKIITASPCPLCRDDYLVVSYKNLDLLNQFISDLTGTILHPKQTGVCMKQQKKLELELARAQDYGVLEKHLKFREYDTAYYRQLAQERTEAMKRATGANETVLSKTTSVETEQPKTNPQKTGNKKKQKKIFKKTEK